MKLIDRYEFTNGKAFETYYLNIEDTVRLQVPACDVIGLRKLDEHQNGPMAVMRPDEALIQARMLIDAVHKATNGFEIKLYESHDGGCGEAFRAGLKPLAMDLVDDLQEVNHAAAKGEEERVEEVEAQSGRQSNRQAQ